MASSFDLVRVVLGLHHYNSREPEHLDGKAAGSNPGRGGGRIFFSRVNFPCRLVTNVILMHVGAEGDVTCSIC